jgi:uncharacterized protein (TIGR00255 family)
MVRSMTAFARLEATGPWGRAVWELRSVNHRYVEVGLRLPEEFRHLESEVRSRIAGKVSRGKVDCALRFDASAGEDYKLRVNLGLAGQIAAAAREIADLMQHATPPSPIEILRWPNVLETPDIDLDAVSKALLDQLEATLDELVDTRGREGEKLKALVISRCDAMQTHTAELRRRVPEIIASIRARHEQRVKEIAPGLDEARLEQECAILAQRLDVAEEIDRLEAHLTEVRRVLNKGEAMGRRLDFLMQELNREANTLGSKSAHIDTASASVELKVLIEQIREQIQNIE